MPIGPLWPLVIYVLSVLLIVCVMIGMSFVLGQRHREPATFEPYESGIVPTGSARVRFSAKFYVVALLFLVFDLEAVFLYAWAVSFRAVGWTGYIGALAFILVLAVVLVYEWRMGALDWSKRRTPTETRTPRSEFSVALRPGTDPSSPGAAS